jgi:Tol biopolymer transport system component
VATEMNPALSSDGTELFFVSDRGGSMEIWRATHPCL